MPFKSRAQARLFYAAAGGSKKWRGKNRPQISRSKAEEWTEETDFKHLPERVMNKHGVRNQMKHVRRKK